MATPCSVKAIGKYFECSPLFKVPNWYLKESYSSLVNSNMKSFGIRGLPLTLENLTGERIRGLPLTLENLTGETERIILSKKEKEKNVGSKTTLKFNRHLNFENA